MQKIDVINLQNIKRNFGNAVHFLIIQGINWHKHLLEQQSEMLPNVKSKRLQGIQSKQLQGIKSK